MHSDTFNDAFIPAASSLREEVLAFAAREYHTKPEYPWAKSPGYAVLRHTDNRKWYGVIMEVPRKRLGIDGCGHFKSKMRSGTLRLPANAAGHSAGLPYE